MPRAHVDILNVCNDFTSISLIRHIRSNSAAESNITPWQHVWFATQSTKATFRNLVLWNATDVLVETPQSAQRTVPPGSTTKTSYKIFAEKCMLKSLTKSKLSAAVYEHKLMSASYNNH